MNSIRETADALNISSVHLGRIIKNGTGMTFSGYVNALRIEEIKNELLFSDKLVKEIAADYGMNEYYMMRLFRKYTGETPTGFRHSRSQLVTKE